MTYLAYAKRDHRNNKVLPSFDVEAATRERLIWAHGIGRAVLIVAGLDPETNRDIERWNRLGRRS